VPKARFQVVPKARFQVAPKARFQHDRAEGALSA